MRRTEKAIVEAECGVKVIGKRSSQELMNLMGLEETADELSRTSGVRCYGHVLRRNSDDLL